ncbi:MAG: MutS family DNA mismatch repair protein [Nitrospiraceae bacterium]
MSGVSRERSLQRVIARADRLIEAGERVSSRFTRWRLAIFITGAILSVAWFHARLYHAGNATLGIFLLIFLVVARYHSSLVTRIHRLRAWRGIKLAHLARLRLDWNGIPARTTPALDAHPYGADLDLVGSHSLFRLLDTTLSSNGQERLGTWLFHQPPDPSQWAVRQSLIKELSHLGLFRDRLTLEASLVRESELNGSRIQAALEAPSGFSGLVPVLMIEAGLAAATVTLALWSASTGLPEYWILTFAAYAAIYLFASGQTAPVFGRALSLHQELDKLGAVFGYLERRSYTTTPALARLCSPLLNAGTQPSAYIRRLARVAQALSVRAHPLVHLALNGIGPWDLFFTYRLDLLRRRVLAEVPVWLETLADVEAASAMATFADLNPDYAWPSPRRMETAGDGAGATIRATALGHPLITSRQRVTNDLDLSGAGRVLLITGSNMSGKSTFLRTIGINTCLAQAGAPVCATSFEWTWVRIFCCIRVDDSLDAGLSFFYAEVKRLKRLLDAARERCAPPVLFLIDEIFKGTNNRERLIGSRAFITALAESNGFGLVTTHDLELAEMENEIRQVTNAHFQETVEANVLKFDYRLRPGPCPTTNALRIMAIEGLPVPSPHR